MADVILESTIATAVALTLLVFLRERRMLAARAVPGWRKIIAGFALILFASLIDITDNFESLNRFVVLGDTEAQAWLEMTVGYLLGFLLVFIGIRQWLPRLAEQQKMVAKDLEQTEAEVKALKGLLPICSSCKMIRDDRGYWNRLEEFIADRTEAEFSHGLCPDCAEKLYPDQYRRSPRDEPQEVPPVS